MRSAGIDSASVNDVAENEVGTTPSSSDQSKDLGKKNGSDHHPTNVGETTENTPTSPSSILAEHGSVDAKEYDTNT